MLTNELNAADNDIADAWISRLVKSIKAIVDSRRYNLWEPFAAEKLFIQFMYD